MSEKRKNSNSEQSLYIDSEEEEEIEEEKVSEQGDGYSSDSSESTSSTHSRPGSCNTAWPRSYRQSMDMYSGVQSPNVGFLGTPSLSKISGSFLSSSLTRRHSPEVIKPLLPVGTDDQAEQRQQLRSSHSLLPPLPTRRSYANKTTTEEAPPKVSHEIQLPRQCSYGQAVLNEQYIPRPTRRKGIIDSHWEACTKREHELDAIDCQIVQERHLLST